VIDQVSIYSALDEVTVLTKGSWLVTVADTDTEVSITGLDDETAYSAYVVVQDEGDDDTATNKYHSNSPTAETTVSRVQFTTLDGTAPVYKGTYTPTVSDIDSASFSLDAQLDEVGKVYYLVVKRTTGLRADAADGDAGAERHVLRHGGVRPRGHHLRGHQHQRGDSGYRQQGLRERVPGPGKFSVARAARRGNRRRHHRQLRVLPDDRRELAVLGVHRRSG
jgi:hypothetical protein